MAIPEKRRSFFCKDSILILGLSNISGKNKCYCDDHRDHVESSLLKFILELLGRSSPYLEMIKAAGIACN